MLTRGPSAPAAAALDAVIGLTVRGQNAVTEFRVSDQGWGIPADDQQHLFEPFFRAASVSHLSGTGLGLAITKNAVELHGGTIRVASTPGQGSTLTVTLPPPAAVS